MQRAKKAWRKYCEALMSVKGTITFGPGKRSATDLSDDGTCWTVLLGSSSSLPVSFPEVRGGVANGDKRSYHPSIMSMDPPPFERRNMAPSQWTPPLRNKNHAAALQEFFTKPHKNSIKHVLAIYNESH